MELQSEPVSPPQLGKTEPQDHQLVSPVNGTGGRPPHQAGGPLATGDQPSGGTNTKPSTSLPDSTTDAQSTADSAAMSPATTVSSIPRLSGIPRLTQTPRSISSSHEVLEDRPGASRRNGHSSQVSSPPATVYDRTRQQSQSIAYCGDSVPACDRRQTSNIYSSSFFSSHGNERSRPSSSTVGSVAGFRYDRNRSQNPCRLQDNMSDGSSSHSAGGTPRAITSKVNSLANVHHKPGGGNVNIVDTKLDYKPVKSKCNSLANVKHTPGGGHVQIAQEKLSFSSVESRVQSLKNVKHIPAGGQLKILSEKLEFSNTAKSRIGSMKNVTHNPGGGDVRIFNESLPWLKYNKPNLPNEEKARINKRSVVGHGTAMTSSSTSGGQ